jgi:hypothetical protein
MAIIKLTIYVEKISNVIALFDVIKIWRSTTQTGTYSEITGLGTRPILVAGQMVYTYDDITGDPSYWYKTSYFNEGTSLESCLSEPIEGNLNALYISIDDIRAEGVTVAKASDEKVFELIQVWQDYIEKVTRNWFVSKSMTLYLDGNGTTLLQLPVPIISVTELVIDDTTIETADYKVYNGRGVIERDDRKNPRVKIVTGDVSIFNGTGQNRSSITLFYVGEKNIKLTGSFGYVEADGTVPKPIQYALKKLVVRRCDPMVGSVHSPAGPVIEEETDRHRRKFSDPIMGSKTYSMTGDLEVDHILAMYKAPLMMKAPRTLYRRLTGGRW